LHGEILEGSGIHLSAANTLASSLEKQTQVPYGYTTASPKKKTAKHTKDDKLTYMLRMEP
jgi:hypothetical protein